MDIKAIQKIVDLMQASDLTEFEIEEQELKLRICRSNGQYITQATPTVPVAAPLPGSPIETGAPAAAPAPEEAGISTINSPMVGTFYQSPSPDSAAFVDINSKVKADSTVCIIEAMKVMNEIQAEMAGTIVEVLVKNGESVEYGQPLFKIKT